MKCIAYCTAYFFGTYSDKQTPKALDSPCHAILFYIFLRNEAFLLRIVTWSIHLSLKILYRFLKEEEVVRRRHHRLLSWFVAAAAAVVKLCLLTIPILFLCHITLQRNAHKTHYYYVTCLIYLCTNSQSQERKKRPKPKGAPPGPLLVPPKSLHFHYHLLKLTHFVSLSLKNFKSNQKHIFRPFSLYKHNLILKYMYACKIHIKPMYRANAHVVNLKIGPQQHQIKSQSKIDNSKNLISILFMYIMHKKRERERVVKKRSRQAIEWMTPFFSLRVF